MYHSYSAALTAAVTMFGENWWRSCTIKQPTGARLTISYYVAFITPKLGVTRPH
jgi:hypothetical protein